MIYSLNFFLFEGIFLFRIAFFLISIAKNKLLYKDSGKYGICEQENYRAEGFGFFSWF